MRDAKAKHEVWQIPGHFYSPIPPHPDAIADTSFDRRDRAVPGIDLRIDEQVALLTELTRFYPDPAFISTAGPSARYYTENDQFPSGDAAGYVMMLRHMRPAHVLEIGSGYSTAVALDAREASPDLDFDVTCIEPYPDRLHRLLRDGDRVDLIERRLEDVSLETFRVLKPGDILFVDSTHVAKLGSDVNYLFEHILPSIPVGVTVHVHDVHWPFEYPRSWAVQGRAWNEAYVLRAFLQFNSAFSITFWANYLHAVRPELFAAMPHLIEDVGSGIWLTRNGA